MENVIHPEDLELFMSHSTLGIGSDGSSNNASDQVKEEYYQRADVNYGARKTVGSPNERDEDRETTQVKFGDAGKDEAAERGYQCDLCGMKFTKNWNLTRHLVIHTDRYKDFRCDTCGKDFFRKSNLDRHMVTHAKDRKRNFQCNVCGKDFLHKVNLKSHVLIHTGVREFKCHLCGKEFPRKTDLNEHLLRHSRQKEFRCEVCGKVFFQKGYLSKHLLSHSNERKRSFHCNMCGKDFPQKSQIIEHTIKVHALQESSNFQASDDYSSNGQSQQTEADTTRAPSGVGSVCLTGEASFIGNEGNGSWNVKHEMPSGLTGAEMASRKVRNNFRQLN